MTIEAPRPILSEADLLRRFAAKHRVKTRRHIDGTVIIPGRLGHVYELDEEQLAVLLTLPSVRHWTFARARLIADGFAIVQNGDSEGCAAFCPSDVSQARAAIREAKIRPRRLCSAGQLASLKRFAFIAEERIQ